MKEDYADVIMEASRILAAGFIARETGLVQRAAELDGDVKLLLWRVGATVMSLLFAALSQRVVDEARQRGLIPDRAIPSDRGQN